MPNYKLHCFHCGKKFKDPSERYRNRQGWPVCEDCCWEDIDMDFDEPDQVLEELRNDRFNRNYEKYLKYLEAECKVCPQCDTWNEKNDFEGDICQNCFEINRDNKKQEVVNNQNVK